MLKQRLKVITVAGFVVVALTGFSRHGHSHSSGGGGGCSGPSHTSSGSTSGGSGSYDSDADSYDTDTGTDTGSSYGTGSGDSYGDDSGGLPASTPGTRYGYTNRPTHRPDSTPSEGGDSTVSATARTVSCAHPAKGGRKAVTSSKVEVKAAGGHGDAVRVYVEVRFADAGGSTVDRGKASVMLKPGQTKTVTVKMSAPSEVSRVASCEASVV